MYRLMFLLNENTNIRVRTPVGTTDWKQVGPTLGQGTVTSAITSSVNLDSGVKEYFHEPEENKINKDNEKENEEEDEDKIVDYDGEKIFPMLYQDDALNINESKAKAQEANDVMV